MTRRAAVTFAVLCLANTAAAQSTPSSAMTAAEVGAALEAAAAATPDMAVARMVNTDAYRVNVVRRTTPQGAIAHGVGTEVHYIVSGTATLVTGGRLERPAGARAGTPATIADGVPRIVHPGDIVLVPVGTPHWYSRIDEPLTYLEVRFDVKTP
ncbi:MAG: cupin domain-containing protein [Vicinamibacterales bacterium]